MSKDKNDLRAEFAAAALTGLVANGWADVKGQQIAATAWRLADAMLAAEPAPLDPAPT